eukprot:Gregarina_sp_Poly_1__4805@NODE_255_length_10547_cov_146_368416_g222_i0_p3_GENE_NODE_255_length_10547_cov_146_368416_g222_i0NODE_255_length_10547_cov_146_368416_g222_i0_p3_ORF_typecomplete_len668_score193_73DUF883/PF05957_13/51DUF883/PF05957_13/14DUF883/PF05957_13/1_7e02DUF883/PF05957_13/1DUF883/PF05957_13/31DUF883/PF05957_13/0_031DUF883/PF05957_13/0_017DUF883/PF05957_13/1_2DUF883/PF05957_13/13LEA_4/PF02987_16/1_8e04LEA_4/PF02987_16/14LEA_4/PF02987_16/0_00038LEA_4/PF02987_16/2_3LEA_4/PF02987_16/4
MRLAIFGATLATFTGAEVPPVIASINPMDLAASADDSAVGWFRTERSDAKKAQDKLQHALSALMSSAADWNAQADNMYNELAGFGIWGRNKADNKHIPGSLTGSLFGRSQKEAIFDEGTRGAKKAVKDADKEAHKLSKSFTSWFSSATDDAQREADKMAKKAKKGLENSSLSFFRRSKTDELLSGADKSRRKVLQAAGEISDDAKRHLKLALDEFETSILGDVIASIFSSSPQEKAEQKFRRIANSLTSGLFSRKSTEEKIRDEILKQFTSRSNTIEHLKKQVNKMNPGSARDKLMKDLGSMEKSLQESMKSVAKNAQHAGEEVKETVFGRRLQAQDTEIKTEPMELPDENEEEPETTSADEETTSEEANDLLGFKEDIKAVGSDIKEGLVTAKDKAADKVKNAPDPEEEAEETTAEEKPAEKLLGVSDDLKQKAEEGGDSAMEKAKEAGEEIKDKAEEAKEGAKGKADEAKDKAEETKDKAKGKAEETEDKAEEAEDKAEDKAEGAEDKAEDKAEEAEDKAEDKADEAEDKAEDKAEEAEDKAEGAKGSAEEVESEAETSAENLKDEAEGKADEDLQQFSNTSGNAGAVTNLVPAAEDLLDEEEARTTECEEEDLKANAQLNPEAEESLLQAGIPEAQEELPEIEETTEEETTLEEKSLSGTLRYE